MQHIVANTPDDIREAIRILGAIHDQSQYPLDIIIKKHTTSVVSSQRGLYWRWLTIMAQTLGGTKLELHNTFKSSIFLNVYIADGDNHPLFNSQLVESMRLVRQQRPGEYATIRDAVLNGVSHLDATRANWIDVLNHIEVIANDHNIKLPASRKYEEVE